MAKNITASFFTTKPFTFPLLFKLPLQHTASRLNTRAGLVDVAPSILQALHLAIPDAMQGQSLLPRMQSEKMRRLGEQGGTDSQRAIYSESGYGHLSFGWSALKSWRTGSYLYVNAPERELYDQTADPAATHNLAADSRAVIGHRRRTDDGVSAKDRRGEYGKNAVDRGTD